MKWISINDDLPNQGERVIVGYETVWFEATFYGVSTHREPVSFGGGIEIKRTIHWNFGNNFDEIRNEYTVNPTHWMRIIPVPKTIENRPFL